MIPGSADDLAHGWDEAVARARDVGAEQSVLGGCLCKPEILDWLDLDPAAFFDPRHSAIWLAMQRIARDRAPLDEVTLAAELQRARKLDLVGGLGYIAELLLRVPTVDNVVAYAELLREHLTTRRLIALAASLPRRIRDGAVGEALLDDLQLGLAEIEPARQDAGGPLSELARREAVTAVEHAERVAKHEVVVGVPTGIPHLDAQIGGMPIGVPTILGARPGNGKSSLALSIALRAARSGLGVHLVTYEDRGQAFAQRALAQESGLTVQRISSRRLERMDVTLLMGAADGLSSMTRLVIDHGHGLPVDRLARMVRARRREIGTGLVVVDYLQLIPCMPHERRWERHERLRSAMNGLAELAAEGVALLVCSQLNRDAEADARRPRLDDFRGTGAIEEVGKLIMALHPMRVENEIEILVLKNASGPTASLIARWDRPRCWIG